MGARFLGYVLEREVNEREIIRLGSFRFLVFIFYFFNR